MITKRPAKQISLKDRLFIVYPNRFMRLKSGTLLKKLKPVNKRHKVKSKRGAGIIIFLTELLKE